MNPVQLSQFVRDFEVIYGKNHMVMNIHLLNHVVDACINLGPLWSQPAFAFEDFNGVLLNYIKGPTEVLLQISSKYVLEKCYIENHVNKRLYDDIVLLGRPHQIAKPITSNENMENFNEFQAFKTSGVEYFLNSKFAWIYNRIQKKGEIYTSERYSRATKSIDYFVLLKNGDFGIAKYYLKHNKQIYAMFEQFQSIDMFDQFQEVIKTNVWKLVAVELILKKYLLMEVHTKFYAVEAPNSFEKD